MTEFEKGPHLTEKLSAITAEIGVIPKTHKEGSGVKYAFRGIDDVMNALSPMLSKHGVTVNVKVRHFDLTEHTRTNSYNKTQVAHLAVVAIALEFSDGVTTEVTEEVACSEDYSDKALTQAMSMAYKYGILRKFCITTADLEDPDNAPQPPTGGVKTPAKEVKPVKPKGKKAIAEMDIDKNLTKEWSNVVSKLQSGMITMAQVQDVYLLTTEQEVKLLGFVKQ